MLTTHGKTYMIPFPQSTRLPVARDDIVFDVGSQECSNLDTQLGILFMQILETSASVVDILTLLDMYEKKSQQSGLSFVISSIKKRLYTIPGKIFVPADEEVYKEAQKSFPHVKFIDHPYPKMYEAEDAVDALFTKYAKTDMFKLRKVICIDLPPGKDYTRGGLSEYIFVRKSLYDDVDCAGKLISSVTNTLLLPHNSEVTKEVLAGLNPYSRIFRTQKIRETAEVVYMTYLSIFENAKTTLKFRTDFIIMFFIIMSHRSIPESEVIKLMRQLNDRISQIKLDFSYGTTPKCGVNSGDADFYFESATLISNVTPEFLTQYLVKMISWLITNISIRTTGSNYWIPDFRTIFYMSAMHYAEAELEELYAGCNATIHEAELFIFVGVFNSIKQMHRGVAKGIGEFIVKEIRRRVTLEQLIELVRSYNGNYVNAGNLKVRVYTPVKEAALMFQEQLQHAMPVSPIPQSWSTYSFTCKSLVQYLYSNELGVSFEDNLRQIHAHARTFDPKTFKLQIVEIAVNDGTTKDFMQAVMTELVQNSIDAIRSVQPDGRINITISKTGVSVGDSVGISPEQVIPILVPFLSSKDPNDPNVTGEMGTGFFNVFRKPWSQGVQIITTRNATTIEIVGTPITQDGTEGLPSPLVKDILYQVKVRKGDPLGEHRVPNGTVINVTIGGSEALKVQSLIDAQNFCKTYLAYTGIPISINDRPIRQMRTRVLTSPLGTVWVAKNRTIQSIVLTNGVPFSTLDNFCGNFPEIYAEFIELGSVGVIFDFTKNVYSAVQSRTKVTVAPAMKEELIKFINNGLFCAILELLATNKIVHPDGILPNLTSTARPVDCMLTGQPRWQSRTASGLTSHENVFQTYIFDFLDVFANDGPGEDRILLTRVGTCLATLCSQYASEFEKRKIDAYSDKYFGTDLISRVMSLWFSRKNFEMKKAEDVVVVEDFEMVKVARDKPIVRESVGMPFPELQLYVDVIWKIFKGLCDGKVVDMRFPNSNPPKLLLGTSANGYDGYYSAEKHTILLSVKLFDPATILETLEKLKATTKPDELAAAAKFMLPALFSTALPASTFSHELLHAFLASSHDSVAHGNVPSNINGKTGLSFDEAAVSVYSLILSRSAILQFMSAYRFPPKQ